MSIRFNVLASGSSGNASVLEVGSFAALIDAGLGPRTLVARLDESGIFRHRLQALLLTHTHSDHWNERTLALLGRQRVPLYCHASHEETLSRAASFAELRAAGLVRAYESQQDLVLTPGFRCRPLPLPHDGGATFGFRFECSDPPEAEAIVVGYLGDLGCWAPELARGLADAHLLALEFNHDLELERNSGRAPELVARVLGDRGHLSNDQAAAFLRALLRNRSSCRLRHVVQMHLSQDCNRPALAVEAARIALGERVSTISIHTASQDQIGPCLTLVTDSQKPPEPESANEEPSRLPALATAVTQRSFPGWNES